MDSFSGYSQILMYPNDHEKKIFISKKGTYSYKVMPFRLKNMRAIYQHLVIRMFTSLHEKIMEFYIDDMLVKSLTTLDHISQF